MAVCGAGWWHERGGPWGFSTTECAPVSTRPTALHLLQTSTSQERCSWDTTRDCLWPPLETAVAEGGAHPLPVCRCHCATAWMARGAAPTADVG